MSATLVSELSDQVQKFWAPMMVDELKESAILPTLVSKEYDGQILQGGDTVYVSMVEAADGSIKTIGVDHQNYSSEKLKTQRIGIVADKIIEASFELDSLIDLQTQLGSPEGKSKIRSALNKGLELQLNKYLYSLVSPSTSAPDHSIASVTDFNASQVLANRLLASQAKWAAEGGWWLLLDPSYYNDFLNAATLTSQDYVGSDLPIIGGKKPYNRFGFNILEDNSAAMNQLSPTLATSDLALAFHPDFMYLVHQMQPTVKISDLHANKQRGYLITAELVVGAKLGIQGNVKHIVTYNS
jgi:hypothetical protein